MHVHTSWVSCQNKYSGYCDKKTLLFFVYASMIIVGFYAKKIWWQGFRLKILPSTFVLSAGGFAIVVGLNGFQFFIYSTTTLWILTFKPLRMCSNWYQVKTKFCNQYKNMIICLIIYLCVVKLRVMNLLY